MSRRPDFHAELNKLLMRLPRWSARLVSYARAAGAWVRVPLALALIICGIVGFLPVLGFWMIPLGFAILAFDLPFLRPPLARLMAVINRRLA